ncbi:tRNA (guanosine(37)-N1)-methyltransferase TrmD [Lysinibacillus fusiformis]|uniref:tRNA (guanosine(37)-N1)-methyltransferase TrmD n=1 Tax=Lysinibacillus TaxID=400634 RepID=UPI0004D73C16|nr:MULTISPECIES: tRNA (guanosine(37)-N1)-methyltransferase TrmD [Lysinibacillus]MDC6268670.1 tRNA (guanosine(37)-N1)-methyltransferase TrmD [Lysinibacillus sphaericus]AJK90127.1 tRNA (guanine-N1)-methyltransferase [Lysinibacillus fusiformis]KAB0442288.1 tRNA (guanosine(37)-N1)-methyltransferase TrmD [Lysinibacillus fusiformis]KGA82775.1 tRNA (guanine-N1)-methyltransferase [Lysinibacillus fusiformis]KHK52801.1 tRNA (guanine-N1)-methyltransferase [Lysinibacillus sp. A1]
MNIHVLSLFPDMFSGVFGASILKKAQEKDAVKLEVTDIRTFSGNKHNQVDDYPYGGGAGMVLKPEPMFSAVEAICAGKQPRIILMCPQGERFTQKKAEELSQEKELVFLCGHYEGYDERIRQHLVTDEISIGDFVLTGGELGAMTVIDSVVRLLPGVLGQEDSHIQDSFSTGLLEHPHYTRPAEFRGMKVPDVLLSGNHAKIEQWREEQSLKRTFERRPDLLDQYPLTDKQKLYLEKLKNNQQDA